MKERPSWVQRSMRRVFRPRIPFLPEEERNHVVPMNRPLRQANHGECTRRERRRAVAPQGEQRGAGDKPALFLAEVALLAGEGG